MYGMSRIYVLWVHESNWFYVCPGLKVPNWLESYTISTGTPKIRCVLPILADKMTK